MIVNDDDDEWKLIFSSLAEIDFSHLLNRKYHQWLWSERISLFEIGSQDKMILIKILYNCPL